jgi:hypothetical protein
MRPKIGKVRNLQSLLAKQLRAVPCALTLALLVLCSAIGPAQTTTSSQINGTVTDSSGALIFGASVTVRNSATGVVYPAVTDNLGA